MYSDLKTPHFIKVDFVSLIGEMMGIIGRLTDRASINSNR